MPIAYLLTFGTYGTHLHGDDRGSHLWRHGYVVPDPDLARDCAARMTEARYVLQEGARDVVLRAIVSHARYRGWDLRAAHVRTEHVHVVVGAPRDVTPKRVMADIKAYATRALREVGIVRAHYWARGGHCAFLASSDEIEAAARYVFWQQGEPMARYPDC
jgi:REP element-mobilizing transposase RayT